MSFEELKVSMVRDDEGRITIREIHVSPEGDVVRVSPLPLFIMGDTVELLAEDLVFFAEVIDKSAVVDLVELGIEPDNLMAEGEEPQELH